MPFPEVGSGRGSDLLPQCFARARSAMDARKLHDAAKLWRPRVRWIKPAVPRSAIVSQNISISCHDYLQLLLGDDFAI
jgi:hypothetical protein